MKRLILTLVLVAGFSFGIIAGPLPTYDPSAYPEISWEELEGVNYTILEDTQDYVIIEIDGKIYIVYN